MFSRSLNAGWHRTQAQNLAGSGWVVLGDLDARSVASATCVIDVHEARCETSTCFVARVSGGVS